MSLYDYFNSFSRYIEAEYPSDKAIVLYWALLDMFNRRGWPEWATADRQKLMSMCHATDHRALKRARDTLCQAGFLEYRPGKKGSVTEYRLSIPKEYGAKKHGESTTGKAPENGISDEYGAKKHGESTTGKAPENGTSDEYSAKKHGESTTEKAPENAVILIKTKTGDFLSSSFSKTKTTTTGAAGSDWSSSASNADREVMARFLEFLPGASEETRERMTEYCRKLGAEVCLRAIDAARDAAPVARNRMAYLFGILRNREADGIRSGADWDAHERERCQHSRDAPARGAQKSAGELYEELQREMFSYDA